MNGKKLNSITIYFALAILTGCGPPGGNGPGDGGSSGEVCEPVERTKDCTFKEDEFLQLFDSSALEPVCETKCKRIGEVRIEVIDGLKTARPLEGFVEMGGVKLANNPKLESLQGLSELQQTTSLRLGANENLKTLSGLDSLEMLLSGLFLGNTALTSLEGIEKLRDPGPVLQFRKNTELASLKALGGSERESITAIRLRQNHALTDLKGLEWVRELGQLSLVNNNGLESLDALHGLKSIRNVGIRDNSSLTQCEIDEFLDNLETRPDLVQVSNNKTDTCNE